MEVIFHDGVGEYGNAAVVGDLPHLPAKHFLGIVIEEAFAVNSAGDAVINGILTMNLYSSSSHAEKGIEKMIVRQEKKICPCFIFL
jgi:hypothetical protein